MPETPTLIRPAEAWDIPAITDIYAHHVLHGTGTFETEPPSLVQMQARFDHLKSKSLPYLVATVGGQVVGYAYAGPFRERAAYRYTVEDSVYLHPEFLGRRIGRMLLERLIADCRCGGFKQMLALIGDSENRRSIRLHEALGFAQAGVLRATGFKHQRWLDVVLMQRPL